MQRATSARDSSAAAERAGGLDLLVHNASALGPSPLPPSPNWHHRS